MKSELLGPGKAIGGGTSTGPTCNASLLHTGLVLCFAVLANPGAQAAASARTPLSPPLPPLPVIDAQPASAVTNQAARPSQKITVVPLPQPELLSPAPNPAVRPSPQTTPDPVAATVSTPQRSPLAWGAHVKEYHTSPAETNAHFTFSVTNTGPTAVVINEVRTSCGCVVATLPEYPWRLAPGTNGQVQVLADVRGQRGLVHKMVYVHTANHGIQSLAIKVHIPDRLLVRAEGSVNSIDNWGICTLLAFLV